MIAGRSAPASSSAALSTPSAASGAAAAGGVGDVGVGLHEDDVERVVEEGRPGRRGAGEVERANRRLADQLRLLDRLRRLRQRRDEREVVDLLEAARAPAHLGGAAAEDDDRGAVGAGAGDRAHPVGDAGAGGQRADAGRAGGLRPALGGERGRLLVADVDDRDALLAAAVVEAEEVPAGEREEVGDAARLQRLGGEPAAVAGAGVGDALALSLLLGCHGREHRHGADRADRIAQALHRVAAAARRARPGARSRAAACSPRELELEVARRAARASRR